MTVNELWSFLADELDEMREWSRYFAVQATDAKDPDMASRAWHRRAVVDGRIRQIASIYKRFGKKFPSGEVK